MNEEPALRARLVSNGEAAVGITLDDLVVRPYIGAHRVHPQAEQSARPEALLGLGDESMGCGPVAVLEDLDADNDRVPRISRQGAQVTVDEPACAFRTALRKLPERDS